MLSPAKRVPLIITLGPSRVSWAAASLYLEATSPESGQAGAAHVVAAAWDLLHLHLCLSTFIPWGSTLVCLRAGVWSRTHLHVILAPPSGSCASVLRSAKSHLPQGVTAIGGTKNHEAKVPDGPWRCSREGRGIPSGRSAALSYFSLALSRCQHENVGTHSRLSFRIVFHGGGGGALPLSASDASVGPRTVWAGDLKGLFPCRLLTRRWAAPRPNSLLGVRSPRCLKLWGGACVSVLFTPWPWRDVRSLIFGLSEVPPG